MRPDEKPVHPLRLYLSGERLYGDDFSPEEIRQWVEDEREAYANLGAADRSTYSYEYHALNRQHLFRHIAGREFSSALGIGSAYGDEFEPIADQIARITILEPSKALSSGQGIGQTPCQWVSPQDSGDLPFATASFDLVVCLGALHHIPNVSHVLDECARTLVAGGVMVVREPIVSLGDWSMPRAGVTRRERGLPLPIFEQMVVDAGFEIQHRSFCVFPLVPRIAKVLGVDAFNSPLLTRVDALAASLTRWNLRYHAVAPWQKIRPTVAAMVLVRS